MKTQSTEEAMDLHTKSKQDLLLKAREIAKDICTKEGTVTSRKVLAEMESQGLIDPEKGQTWVGAVFRRDFIWTGEWVTHSNKARNIHERTIKVWSLC